MPRSEHLANLAIAETPSGWNVGRHFHARGPVRAYRKPSLLARVLAIFA